MAQNGLDFRGTFCVSILELSGLCHFDGLHLVDLFTQSGCRIVCARSYPHINSRVAKPGPILAGPAIKINLRERLKADCVGNIDNVIQGRNIPSTSNHPTYPQNCILATSTTSSFFQISSESSTESIHTPNCRDFHRYDRSEQSDGYYGGRSTAITCGRITSSSCHSKEEDQHQKRCLKAINSGYGRVHNAKSDFTDFTNLSSRN